MVLELGRSEGKEAGVKEALPKCVCVCVQDKVPLNSKAALLLWKLITGAVLLAGGAAQI